MDKPVYRGQLPITRDIYRKAGPVESAAVSTVKWRSILEDKITVLPSATREVLNRTGHFYKQYQSTSVRSNTAGGCPLSRQERDIVINQANMILAEKFQGLALTEAQVETVVKLVQGESVLHVEAVGE